MGRPYIYYLLLGKVALDLLYISNFERYECSNFELIKYLKFVKLRRLYDFPLGSHVLIGLKRTTLVLLFLVSFMYNFNELLLFNSLNLLFDIISLLPKKATSFDPGEVKWICMCVPYNYITFLPSYRAISSLGLPSLSIPKMTPALMPLVIYTFRLN